ncbi:hypothetical protein Calag_1126 [Caldisphaera lagunensis DSM 15908]|uniref:DUF72 domain-containing protein n=1 Tax=Caldisphaera lagunensis (strain DSM 15908 / JCM 11604 / ANMR 0165 / IC-154) TaxID=1056495 RepID=L0AAB4_CALLD|nr:DUF72 domain-containing protein [Caldisphaera lagunensis]AFZ70848.1 hypothetical protein Calag_1126 [Caldisphaera lagunensis DSM 15908]
MEIFVGTSGWMYSWNKGRSLDWYIKESGFNTVELNASFYRFPYKNQIKSWSEKGSSLRWAIKVHKSVSHTHRLNKDAIEVFKKFLDAFSVMDNITSFYLIQLPPSFNKNDENLDRLLSFIKEANLGRRLAIEFRHKTWFNEDTIDLFNRLETTFVSVSSPIIEYIAKTNDIIYLRMHGKTKWYYYEYSEEELNYIAKTIINLNPKEVYVYFNNDLWMLSNGQYLMNLMKKS